MVNAPISAIDLEDLQLSRKAANYEQTAGNSFVDLHDSSDIVLTILKPNFTLVFVPIQVEQRLVNARQVLVDDPLAAVQSFPHCDVPDGMARNYKIVYLAKAVDWVVLINIGDV